MRKHPLILQVVKKALRGGAILAIAPAARRADHAVLFLPRLKRPAHIDDFPVEQIEDRGQIVEPAFIIELNPGA